jgi:hypothetical protein
MTCFSQKIFGTSYYSFQPDSPCCCFQSILAEFHLTTFPVLLFTEAAFSWQLLNSTAALILPLFSHFEIIMNANLFSPFGCFSSAAVFYFRPISPAAVFNRGLFLQTCSCFSP